MFDLIPYRLPLARPLLLAGGIRLTRREGLWLHHPETDTWGDAAPLPGFSRETLDEVLKATQRGDWDAPHVPSLRFAVDCALRPPPRIPHPLPVNALWQPGAESVQDLLARLRDWRKPVVKVKCVTEDDLTAVCALLDQREDIRVRLDPNRQWSVPQTLAAFTRIVPERLDYIEEPLQSALDYESLWRKAPVPIALDETLLDPEGVELSRAPNVVALVIKPTLLGAQSDLESWGFHPRRVISSCFESGVGLWHLAAFANPGEPSGLDTARLFARDPVHPRPLSHAGFLPPLPDSFQLPASR